MRIGIDLGGTKIEGIAIDKNGNEYFRKRINSPQGNYQNTLNAIVNLIKEIEVMLKHHVRLVLVFPAPSHHKQAWLKMPTQSG